MLYSPMHLIVLCHAQENWLAILPNILPELETHVHFQIRV